MKRKFFNVFSKYPAYFIVGGFVTLITIVIRDLIGKFLYRSELEYILSIVIVYSFGIVLSYFLQSRFTFKTQAKQIRSFKYKFSSYTVIQIVGMGVTIGSSLLFRHLLSSTTVIAQFRDTIAFIIASLIASVVTYTVSRMHIFKEVNPKK